MGGITVEGGGLLSEDELRKSKKIINNHKLEKSRKKSVRMDGAQLFKSCRPRTRSSWAWFRVSRPMAPLGSSGLLWAPGSAESHRDERACRFSSSSICEQVSTRGCAASRLREGRARAAVAIRGDRRKRTRPGGGSAPPVGERRTKCTIDGNMDGGQHFEYCGNSNGISQNAECIFQKSDNKRHSLHRSGEF